MTPRPWFVVAVVLGAASPHIASAQCEIAALQANDAEARDQFGEAVGVAGNAMLVAAPHETDNGEKAGAAYFFRRDNGDWVFDKKVIAPDGAPQDEFAGRIALDGDLAAVMAIFDDDNGPNSGSVYLYRHDGVSWAFEQKVVGGAPVFATAVALSGDRLLVGAAFDDGPAPEAGSAAVFQFDGQLWTLQQQLEPDESFPFTRFGAWVAIDGDMALIGAPFAGLDGSPGAVYAFEFDGTSWAQVQKIVPLDGDPSDEFGTTVVLEGDTALIGCPRDDDLAEDRGSAYSFRYDGIKWVQQQKLLPPSFPGEQFFGERIAIQGEVAIVAAPPGFGLVETAGAVYLYERLADEWIFVQRLEGSDALIGDNFGYGMGLDGDVIAVGAMMHDEPELNEGAVYVFDLPACLAVPEPASLNGFTVQRGELLAGDVLSLELSDDDVLLVDAELNAASTRFATIVTVFAQSAVLDISEVTVTAELGTEIAPAAGAMRLRNFDTDRWEFLGSFSLTTDDHVYQFSAPPDAAAFVDPRTGEIRLQLVSRVSVNDAPGGYRARIDQVQVEVIQRTGASR